VRRRVVDTIWYRCRRRVDSWLGVRLAGNTLVLLTAVTAQASSLAPDTSILVKFHSNGPIALRECAEEVWESGRPLASARSDRSEVMDRFHKRFRTRSVRALFRRPIPGEPFREQREALAERGRRQQAIAAARRATRIDDAHRTAARRTLEALLQIEHAPS